MTTLTPATTSHRVTSERIRAFFAYVPKGARYYLTTFDTAAIGSPPEATKYSLDRLVRELRAGAKDPGVTNVTVLIMYDGPTEGGGRTPDPEPPQLLLPLGTTPDHSPP